MAKTIDQLTALAATPDDSADALLISDAGVTKKITPANLKGDCVRAAKNNALDASVGTKIGTNANQLLGFWNATPVVQPAAAAQAAAAAQTQDTLTDSTGGSASTTLAVITAPAANDTTSLTDDMTAVKNALASLAAQLALVKTDVANIKTLQDATRTALVNTGLIKGAA
jgi:hypothetical protein